MMRKYHLVAVNIKTGEKTYMTDTPVYHEEACTMKSKLANHPLRMIQLEEVNKNT